jgi:TetR/AcrR family transcriptional regulator, transcriptional repressor for nem operon
MARLTSRTRANRGANRSSGPYRPGEDGGSPVGVQRTVASAAEWPAQFNGLVRWRNALVQRNAAQNGAYGCALGSMATEVSDHDDEARETLSATFQRWEQLLADGLRRMQDSGRLRPDADADALATGLIAALQGGYLLAQTARDVRPMEIALDMALDHVRTLLTS